MELAYLLASTVAVPSLLLALHGYRSVGGSLREAARTVARVVTTASTYAQRFQERRAKATIVIDLAPAQRKNRVSWIVVAETAGAVVSEPLQLIRPSAPRTEVVLPLEHVSPKKVQLKVAVYDSATLAPLAILTTVVPAVPMFRRLLQIFRRLLQSGLGWIQFSRQKI